MVLSSKIAILGNILMILLWIFGDPTTLSLPGYEGFHGFTFFTVALLVLTIVTGGFQNVASSIVIPMTADCADYETYRSGRYVPGLMGTGLILCGLIVNVIAMHFYPLDAKKMEEVRREIADVKAKYESGNTQAAMAEANKVKS